MPDYVKQLEAELAVWRGLENLTDLCPVHVLDRAEVLRVVTERAVAVREQYA